MKPNKSTANRPGNVRSQSEGKTLDRSGFWWVNSRAILDRGGNQTRLDTSTNQTEGTIKNLVGTLLFTLLMQMPSAGTILMGPVVNPANNHVYYLLAPTTWTASQAQALTLGGHLVTINDAAENAWVYATFGGLDRPLWLGLTDHVVEGTFAWISGEPVTFTNWSPGEPNNGSIFVPDEDYVYMVEANPAWPLNPGQWNDVPVDGEGVLKPVYGVVEVVPEPSVLVMGLLGLMACGFKRKSLCN
jgi:hypothetical protein